MTRGVVLIGLAGILSVAPRAFGDVSVSVERQKNTAVPFLHVEYPRKGPNIIVGVMVVLALGEELDFFKQRALPPALRDVVRSVGEAVAKHARDRAQPIMGEMSGWRKGGYGYKMEQQKDRAEKSTDCIAGTIKSGDRTIAAIAVFHPLERWTDYQGALRLFLPTGDFSKKGPFQLSLIGYKQTHGSAVGHWPGQTVEHLASDFSGQRTDREVEEPDGKLSAFDLREVGTYKSLRVRWKGRISQSIKLTDRKRGIHKIAISLDTDAEVDPADLRVTLHLRDPFRRGVRRDTQIIFQGVVRDAFQGERTEYQYDRKGNLMGKVQRPCYILNIYDATLIEEGRRGLQKEREKGNEESAAASKLRIARIFLKQGKTAMAEKWLNIVLKDYPDTRAADKAKSLLDQLK